MTGASSTSEGGSSFRRWLDERMGLNAILHAALNEPIPGGARWAYIFGSGLLFLIASQVLTGVALALYYVPAANDAHITVAYIVKVVTGGSFLRSLHSYGASAMIVVLLPHIIQTFFYGAYKGRRELVWFTGCALLALVLGIAFTGYLLPWDQKAYFATVVGTNVMGELPLAGNLVRKLLRGGNQLGTVTLSRFFVLHVFVLPGLIVALIVTHVYLFRKVGPAGPIDEHPVSPRMPTETFYPRQLGRDLIFVLLLMLVLGVLAYFFPVQLGPQANTADTAFLPRPEWYFLPIFEWLKFWPGKSALIGVVMVPTIVTFLLVAAPLLDRGLDRHTLKRPLSIASFCVVLGGMVAAGVLSHVQDRRDPLVAAQMARQDRAERVFMRAPFVPRAIVAGATAAASSPAGLAGAQSAAPVANSAANTVTSATIALPHGSPGSPAAAANSKSAPPAAPATRTAVGSDVAQGRTLFLSNKCTDCHGDNGEGTDQAPNLTVLGANWPATRIANFIQNPSNTALEAGMPNVPATSPDLKALVAYVLSLQQ